MAPNTGLLACSNEVLTMIFNNPSLSKKDIKSLRLTSKELCPAATREFAMRYISEPYVVWTRDSLQTLVEVCQHPIFGPQIRSIGFLTTTLSDGGLRSRSSNLTFSIVEDNKNGNLARKQASIKEYGDLCIEQTHLIDSGKGKKLLVKALSALGRPFTIRVTNEPQTIDLRQVLSLSKIMYRYGFRPGDRVYVSSDICYQTRTLFGLIEEAIAEVRSGTMLRSLDFFIRHHYNDSIMDVTGFYKGMRELCFDVDTATLRDGNTFGALKRLLMAAPNLELLTFSAGRNNKRPVPLSSMSLFTDILSIETTYRLQVLKLQEMACSLDSLQKLMEIHKQTLIRIEFVRVMLLGSWKDCLLWIRKELELVEFHIEKVCNLDRNKTNVQGPCTPKVSKHYYLPQGQGQHSRRARRPDPDSSLIRGSTGLHQWNKIEVVSNRSMKPI